MIIKKIKCPKCEGVIEVKNSNDEKVLQFKCPNASCGATIRLFFDTGETVLAMPKSKETFGAIYCNRVSYPLNIGKQTMGRMSTSQHLDIAIPTNDLSMSRLHAEIEVVKLSNGRIKPILQDLRDKEKVKKKPIKIAGEYLYETDRIVLQSGDIFTLGDTNFQYLQE